MQFGTIPGTIAQNLYRFPQIFLAHNVVAVEDRACQMAAEHHGGLVLHSLFLPFPNRAAAEIVERPRTVHHLHGAALAALLDRLDRAGNARFIAGRLPRLLRSLLHRVGTVGTVRNGRNGQRLYKELAGRRQQRF